MGASRAMTARLLLYRPRSRARRDILFELLHNPEEYTVSSAFCLAKALEDLDDRDYRKLEANQKYKKAARRPFPCCAARVRKSSGMWWPGSWRKIRGVPYGALDLALGNEK